MAVLNLVRPVLPANLLGLPAAVVPAGLADGLPAGVQIVGARFSEMRCLAAAESIEAALGALTPVDPTREHGGAQHCRSLS
jgi:amidase